MININKKYYCIDCEKELNKSAKYVGTKRCWVCCLKWRKSKEHLGWKGGKITKICKNCNKPFDTYLSKTKTGRGKYCSNKCKYIIYRLINRDKKSPHYKKGKPHCKQCGKEIGYDHKLCFKCWCKNNKGKKHISWKGGWKNKLLKCINCGKQVKTYYAKRCQKCSSKENGKLQLKQNHPNWQGGISKQPYPFDFDEKLKEYIRNRDGNKCQLCSTPQRESIKRLAIHHIDYDKNNLSEVNLLSLCNSCNTKVNKNRKYWEEYFTNLMISRIEIKKGE